MRRRTVTLAPEAIRDLEHIKQWLLQQGAGRVARRRYHAILQSIARLNHSPVSYRRSEDHPGLRVISVAGHRVLYRVVPDTGENRSAGDVRVLTVLGPGEP